MNSIPLSFLTPVKYGHQPTSLHQKMIETADAYFNVGGQVAVVVAGKELNGSKCIELRPGQTIWWQTTLKVMSYTAFLLNFLLITQFPGLRDC